MLIEPRHIEPQFAKWYRQALSLMTRAPVLWILLAVGGCAACGVAARFAMPPVVFFFGGIFVHVGCALAMAVDRPTERRVSWRSAWWVAIAKAAALAVVWFFLTWLFAGESVAVPTPGSRSAAPSMAMLIGPLAPAVFVYCVLSFPVAWLSPWAFLLVVGFGCSWREAASLAHLALVRNTWVFLLLFAMCGATVACAALPLLALPLACFSSALLYVAFRAVFLGEQENSPAPELESANEPARPVPAYATTATALANTWGLALGASSRS